MKIRNFIIVLIVILITIILIDILTGIFYWNRQNLEFNIENFNNLVTPLVALISLIVYSLALIINFKQSQIIQSQHLKPNFTEEIQRLKSEFEKTIYRTDLIKTSHDNCNGINYPSVLMEQIKTIINSHEFLDDLDSFEKGVKYNHEYFKDRDYYKELVFISQFTFDLNLSFKYKELIELGEEINASKLLKSDKEQLKRTIKKEILIEYLSFIEFEKGMKNLIPKFPELYSTNVLRGEPVGFNRITNTSFSKHYKKLKRIFDTNLKKRK